MDTTTATNGFLMRLLGAAALDPAIYEEVEADPKATTQAAVIVLASSLAAGIGARGFADNNLPNVALISIVALMAWACWALLTYEIGARLLPEPQTAVDVGQLMRTIGFASTPGVLRVFGFIPGVTTPVFVVSALWMLAAMVVAVRHALDYTSTGRAIAVCAIGWTLALVFALVLGLAFTPAVS
jgi:hypothetical protein